MRTDYESSSSNRSRSNSPNLRINSSLPLNSGTITTPPNKYKDKNKRGKVPPQTPRLKGIHKFQSIQSFQREINNNIRLYLRFRNGLVLNKGLILKLDKFPLKESGTLQIPITISGARNLRQGQYGRIFGAGQPTIAGIYGVLNILRSGREYNYQQQQVQSVKLTYPVLERHPSNLSTYSTQGLFERQKKKRQTEVLWINLREEPILYINNRAVVLRDFEEPFQNLQYFRGIRKDRIEEIEWKLKEDCVRETRLNGGNLMVHREDRTGQLHTFWEAVKIDQIKTSREVFFQFQMEGYRVRYKRLPSTSQRAPPKRYFDLLLKYVMHTSVSSDTAIVVNCQTGVSRSTFSMVAVCLIKFWRGQGRNTTEEQNLLSVVLTPYNYRKQNLFHAPSSKEDFTYALSFSGSDTEKEKAPNKGLRRENSAKTRSKSLLKAALNSQTTKEKDFAVIQEHSNLPPAEEALNLGSQENQALKSFERVNVLNQIDYFSKNKTEASPIGKPIKRVLSGRTLASMEQELEIEKSPMMKPSKAPNVTLPEQLTKPSLTPKKQKIGQTDRLSFITDRLLKGWYQPVINLLRLLESGLESKSHVDYFIDKCDRLLNIREAIYKYRAKASETQNVQENEYFIKRASTELVRYLLLIIFDAYLNEQIQKNFPEQSMDDFAETGYGTSDNGNQILGISFQNWLDSRPELRKVIADVQNNPEISMSSPVFLVESHNSQYVSDVVKFRHGSMLSQDSILKVDNFASFEAPKSNLGILIKGAVNFRIINGTQIGACGSPTLPGIMGVVQYLKACSSATNNKNNDVQVASSSEEYDESTTVSNYKTRIIWINLREEPILYINKKPAMLRSMAKPFQNVQVFDSINEERLEKAEDRLKADVIREANLCNGKLLIHMEEKKFELVPVLEDINFGENLETDDALTVKEANEKVSAFAESCSLEFIYRRVALTPEKPPTPTDIDKLLFILDEAAEIDRYFEETYFVYSCQIGKGRSTVASIIAYLHQHCSLHSSLLNDMNSDERYDIGNIVERKPAKREENSSSLLIATESGDSSDGEADYFEPQSKMEHKIGRRAKEPQFNVVLALMRLLQHGKTAQKWTNLAIKKCGSVENILVQIKVLKEKASHCRHKERAVVLTERALMYLQRYFMIILVAAYILARQEVTKATRQSSERRKSASSSPSTSPSRLSRTKSVFASTDLSTFSETPSFPSFSEWFNKRKELSTLFQELNHKDALNVQQNKVLAATPIPGEFFVPGTAVQEDNLDVEVSEKEVTDVAELVASREGSVLVNGSILKEDHFPGSERLKEKRIRIEGSPNFRPIEINLTPEESSVQLTEINSLLRTYGVGIPTLEGLKSVVKFVQERDNPKALDDYLLVWINLREEPIIYIHGKPYVVRKLEHPYENLEHTGINTERVENMEERLKIDVIAEIQENNGMLLLHGEDEFGLTPGFEKIDLSDPLAVLTPKELYERMKLNFNLKYYRIPITDEQAPKILDYDRLIKLVDSTDVHKTSFVLNCQMGRGRTTTGSVIVTALRLWQLGLLFSAVDVFEEFIKLRHAKQEKINFGLNKQEIKYKQGKIRSIISLTRVLENGALAKSVLDVITDLCEKMQNLREAIYDVKQLTEKNKYQSAARQASITNRGREYLKRYAQLMVFFSYLLSMNHNDYKLGILGATSSEKVSFSKFMFSRKEVQSMLNRISFP